MKAPRDAPGTVFSKGFYVNGDEYTWYCVARLSWPSLVRARLSLRFTPTIATAMPGAPAPRPDARVLSEAPSLRCALRASLGHRPPPSWLRRSAGQRSTGPLSVSATPFMQYAGQRTRAAASLRRLRYRPHWIDSCSGCRVAWGSSVRAPEPGRPAPPAANRGFPDRTQRRPPADSRAPRSSANRALKRHTGVAGLSWRRSLVASCVR